MSTIAPARAFGLGFFPEQRVTPEEIDIVDWVFNASPVLKERAEMMALHEGMTYEREPEKRAPNAQRSLDFIERITGTRPRRWCER